MKKKNGFTLIELLAVIVILAIIALIATPIILNIVERARKSAFQDSAYGLVEAAKLKYVEGMLDGSSSAATYTFDGTTNSGLEFSGSTPDSGELKVDSNGNIALAVVYGNVCYKKDYTESEITQTDDTINCALESLPPELTSPKCKRATTLHTEECARTDSAYYCSGAGYTTDNKGTTIEYGNLGTGTTLTSGDAFDCDVNGDGTYDAATERFYYVSDLYNTTTQSFDSNYAVLVYYNNTTAGVSDNTSASLVAYDSTNENWHGPQTAIANLPTTTQWSNISLSNTSRKIITEIGTNTTTDETTVYNLPVAFDYSGYAARLLTVQEVNSACGIIAGTWNAGELDGCNYLIENTAYSSSVGKAGYWLETPSSSSSIYALSDESYKRGVSNTTVSGTTYCAARPAIEVLKTDIEK